MENREAIEYLIDVRNGIHIPSPGRELPLLNEQEKKAIDMAISALEKQEQDRWIPVTERLPKKPGWYAITVHYEAIPEDEDGPEIPEKWWTGVAYWDWDYPNDPTKKERGKRWVNAYDYDGYVTTDDCITAWRPLPEAFEAEEES